MKKLLPVLAFCLFALAATSAEAGGRGHSGWHGYHGGYHGWHGGYHGWRGGYHGSYFWWSAPLIVGAAIAWPYYYSRAWDAPYYSPSQTTVYVQNPPTYVTTTTQPSYQAVAQAPNSGVIELGPVNGAQPQIANPQSVVPAPATEPERLPPPVAGRWFVYPAKGQSDAQLASDQTECSDWATRRSGYDPDMRYNNHPPSAYNDYGRALSACLEGRGYTVR
ncbi:MAG TPA: hypothetical protein VFV71_01675 [Burkholderiales bacterium]|nr:hypothetical protein [Burkholderiales bacterium]